MIVEFRIKDRIFASNDGELSTYDRILSAKIVYGGSQILVQKVFEGDLSCDGICMQPKF